MCVCNAAMTFTGSARLMSEDLKGADYRAVTRLSTGDDVTLAEAGETCTRVPVESLAGLLTHGYIEPVTAPAAPEGTD